MLYGPGDTSQLGQQFRLAAQGKLRYMAFPTLGFAAVYVDDAADGILRVLDRGRIGETYVLGGERTTMREAIETAARVGGKQAPRLVMPTWAINLSAPLGRWLGPLSGQPPNLREVVTASHGVTYWASDAKARKSSATRRAGSRRAYGSSSTRRPEAALAALEHDDQDRDREQHAHDLQGGDAEPAERHPHT